MPFLQHMPHRQARALAITPRRAVDRRQHGFGFDLADALQVIFQHALLDVDLRTRFQMLHRAAAAHAEMRALRLHAHERLFQDLADMRLLIAGLFTIRGIGHALARQRAFDEDYLAVGMRDTPAFLVEGFNDYRILLQFIFRHINRVLGHFPL